ncbi:aspartate-ammonia ligase [Bacillus sp. OK838]|nr:aspartate-ammonia ligase [Bacillus sp. OK838]
MPKLSMPNKYKSILDIMHTDIAINEIKGHFEEGLSNALNLIKVSAPTILNEANGINDNLNGVERILTFDALDIKNKQIEVVQSLAKWKRITLSRYGLTFDEGIYTNMNAIRRDEKLDNLRSLFVDQWDWEKVIAKEQRNLNTLKSEVKKIYKAIKATELHMFEFHPMLRPVLPNEIHFITTQELEDLYPNLTPTERENVVAKKYGAIFIMKIGKKLQSGEKHDGRSPDYDDWELNGDIVLWNPLLECAFEVSSMGIRVDEDSLLKQLRLSKNEDRTTLEYHKSVLEGKLPHSIGGGIGQSRLCMFLLKKAHIGEVQVSVWNDQILKECKERNIILL